MPWNDDRLEILFRQLQEQLRVDKIREETAAEVYELAYPNLYSYFSARRCPPEDCKDLTQDSLIRVFTGVRAFRFGSRCSTWMTRIAFNVFANYLRSRGAAIRQESRTESLETILAENPGRLPGQASARDQLVQQLDRERHDRVRRAVDSMPDQMRKCFFLRYDRGFKYREIAVLMKITLGAVKAHLHQARERIKEQVGIDPGGGGSEE
jgi:RNA polymerase sigma-70 factor (ECF subfamily)